MVTKDGDTATLTLSGITIPKGLPPIGSIRGATFFNTQSPKLARLNSVVCVFEAEVNADHSYSVKDWEWKQSIQLQLSHLLSIFYFGSGFALKVCSASKV